MYFSLEVMYRIFRT